jgi:hypothetical protein
MSIISNFYKISFLIGFIFCVSTAFAQEKSSLPTIDFVVDFAIVDPNIDEATAQKIKEQVKIMMQRYAYSSSFGEYTGEFSPEKYEMFSKLFTTNARLTNYIIKKPIQQETFKYTGFIYDNIRPKSIEQKFRSGELLSIEKDASGNFRCTVVFALDVNSIYDDKTKKLSSSPKARRVALKGLAILEPAAIERGSFIMLTGDKDDVTDSKTTINLGGLYSIGSLSGGTNRGFNGVKPTSNALGLYVDLSKSVGASGKWHIWAGVGYQSISFTTDITEKYTVNAGDVSNFSDQIEKYSFNGSTFPQSTTPSDVYISGINFGEESISGANLLNGAFGLGYQTKMGLKNKLMLKFGVIPTYLMNVSKGSRVIDFKGYELPKNSNFPNKEELDRNGVGELYNFSSNGQNTPGQENVITAENNFSLSALIAPSIQIPIGFNWGLDIGLAYSLGINNLFKHTPSDNNFLGRGTNESKSIIQDFLPSSKHNQLQVRAGVFLNLN